MDESEIITVVSHAEMRTSPNGLVLVQFADITLRIPKDYDFEKNGKMLLLKLKRQADLIGRREC